MPIIQIQIGGRNNFQSTTEDTASLGRMLNIASRSLSERSYDSNDVKEQISECIDNVSSLLCRDSNETLCATKYIVFPFFPNPEREYLEDDNFIRSMLEALALIRFANVNTYILDSYINISISGRNTFGIYYTKGSLDLNDSYIRLLRCITEKKTTLPPNFVSIHLGAEGDYTLDEDKTNNIITNIMGNSAYILPLKSSNPKCLKLSSYIINKLGNVVDARNRVKEVLGIE